MQFARYAMFGLTLAGCLNAGSASAGQSTEAFLANARPNVDFLDQASRLALQKSTSRSVKAYAREVAERETIVGNSLTAVWQSGTSAGASAALGTPGAPEEGGRNLLAPIGTVAGNVASRVSSLVDGSLLTGRSVALTVPAPVPSTQATPSPSTQAKPLLPSQGADYQTLTTLSGRRFDAFYKVTQRNALRQLVALYRDYASQGDDPALRSLSTLQLVKTNDLIRRLNALR